MLRRLREKFIVERDYFIYISLTLNSAESPNFNRELSVLVAANVSL
jgi:hypothetical protein